MNTRPTIDDYLQSLIGDNSTPWRRFTLSMDGFLKPLHLSEPATLWNGSAPKRAKKAKKRKANTRSA